MMDPQQLPEVMDVEPEEHRGTTLVRVLSEADPDKMLALMEKKASLGTRMRSAVEGLLLSHTYPRDWNIQGNGDKATACLGSAGAERVAREFPINFTDVSWTKEEWTDSYGAAYRYVYTGYASLYDRKIFIQGRYSTRDAFLGKVDESWRAIEDINEGNIRSAAFHMMRGDGIKALLGLRGLPAAEYERIMRATSRDPSATPTVARGSGTQGGTSADDHKAQADLAEACISIAAAGMTVESDGKQWSAVPMSDSDDRAELERAVDICIKLSSFTGKDGKEITGKPASQLKGKWLANAHKTAQRIASGL